MSSIKSYYIKKVLLQIAVFFCFSTIIYAQAGKLDSSFGTNSLVKTNIGSLSDVSSGGKQVWLQADGSMYIRFEARGQSFIQKRLPDGSVDISYGFNGFIGSDDI